MSSDDERKIRAVMMIEIIGRPPEHLTEALTKIIEQLDNEKGVSVVEKKIHEPVLMKNQENFYTSFAEVEVEVEEVLQIAGLMFKYMPGHIEIIHPESFTLKNSSFNDILNELTRRLHGYDEIARVLQIEKGVLEKKLKGLLDQGKKD